MAEPVTEAGRGLWDYLVYEVGLADERAWLSSRIAWAEKQARAAVLREVAEKVSALNWYEPGLDGCEEHQPNWNWGPDQWAHLERAAVLAILTEPTGASE